MQHIDAGMNLLRSRYAKHPEWFRSNRMCMVDSRLQQMWTNKFQDFLDSEPNPDGTGRRLPGGAYDYYSGEEPSFHRSDKMWGVDVDDIYSPLNIGNSHWVALWISIPNRHITVWDSAAGLYGDMTERVKPFAVLVPYILRELASPQDRICMDVTPYSHECVQTLPQNTQSGDCGVYCLKYIECHALGIPWPQMFCDTYVGLMRDKLCVEIYDELGIMGTELRDYKDLDTYDETGVPQKK